MKYKILKDFDFAHGGCDVKSHKAGDEAEFDEPEFHRIAIAEGWAEVVGAPKHESAHVDAKHHKAAKAK